MVAPQSPDSSATIHDFPQSPSSPQRPSPATHRSSSRGSIGRTLSLLGARMTTSLGSSSAHPEHGQGKEKTFEDDEITLSEEKERSVSRGRDALTSTGRGGAGNIRSISRDARPSGPHECGDSRGREPREEHLKIFSTGRGGAGNFRSPSRDVGIIVSGADDKDQGVIRSHMISDQETGVHSTGRGGIGNIRGGSKSRSRSRAREVGSGTHTPIHSTGRGGAGNIYPGPALLEVDERGRDHINRSCEDDIHSTGRGGVANITHLHSPPVEHSHHTHHHGDYESTGRGGVGNIVHG